MSLEELETEDDIRERYKLGPFTFDTLEEFGAASRDLDKIQSLKVTQNMSERRIRKVLKKIKEQNITFESFVGEEFLKTVTYRATHSKSSYIRRILIAVCYLVVIGTVGFFITDGYLEYQSKKELKRLQNQMEEALKQEAIAQEERQKAQTGSNAPIVIKDNDIPNEKRSILPEFVQMSEENYFFSGWLTIDGTSISYPVTKGPNNEFYLSHNIQDGYDRNGMLIMDMHCEIDGISPQYIIYGHNVSTGRMFGSLNDYKKESYAQNHKTVEFSTLYDRGVYEVFAAFIVPLGSDEPLADFYDYTEFLSKEEFDEFIDKVKQYALYTTNVEPIYGEPLLSLVTCEYTKEDGRFVVLTTRKELNN